MKKLTAMMCAAAMALNVAMSAAAAPSIGQLIPESPHVVEANIPQGYELVIQEVAADKYENRTVADVVTKFNDDTVKVTVAEALEMLDVETEDIKTTDGNDVDPTAYEALMPFVDVALIHGTEVSYTIDSEVKVTFTAEVTKNLKAEDLLIMQIDPATGEVYFIEIGEEDFDAETGEITVTFPGLGPFTILEKGAAA